MKKVILGLVAMATFTFTIGIQDARADIIYPDPTLYAIQYGDFYSYSMPILNHIFGDGGGYNSSSDWYIDATKPKYEPVVIYTNANNVDDNIAGMDDAYESVTGNQPQNSFFNTNTTTDPPPPAVAPSDPKDPAFPGDSPDYWDAQLSTMLGYLDGGPLYFHFNNNQLNSTADGYSQQNLFAWGQVQIVDLQGVLPTLYFDFADVNTGNNVYNYSNAVQGNNGPGPLDEYVDPTDPGSYVMSGGYVCLGTAAAGYPIMDCAAGGWDVRLAHNLGFNAVAYTLFSPELSDGLAGWFAGGYDIMRVDMRLRALNNGAEQLFILTQNPEYVIPEPSTFVLLGAGLLGLGYCARRRSKK